MFGIFTKKPGLTPLMPRRQQAGKFRFLCRGCGENATTGVWFRRCELGKDPMWYEGDLDGYVFEFCDDCMKKLTIAITEHPTGKGE
jgi:hypothetical protein